MSLPICKYRRILKKRRVKLLSTAEVASRAGVHKDTLLRWLRDGLIAEPHRDRHGWRVFTEAESSDVVAFAESERPPREWQPLLREQTAPYVSVQRVKEIDWDFREAKTTYLTHGLHPYPAKFIPQIPNALIQEFSSIGNTVGDIFCGSGTTLVEGMLLKRNVVGVDANPLACLISAAKTTRLEEGDRDALLAIARRSIQLANDITPVEGPTLFPVANFVSSAPRPDDKAIAFWFEPFVVEELAEALSWCQALGTDAARNLALTTFSAIIVNVSRQDSDTRYVRRRKNLRPGDTLRRFGQALTDNTNAVEKFSEIIEPTVTSQIFHADVLEAPQIPQLDLVVCSPPYPNAYSYHLYHMTRMIWLGMDQLDFKKREIGSHRKFSSKGKSGASIETFRTEMRSVLGWLHRVVRPGGLVCLVVGNSIIRGRTYDNADVLRQAAASTGFVEVVRLNRNLKDTSKAFNPRIGKIKTERIVVLQNSGS